MNRELFSIIENGNRGLIEIFLSHQLPDIEGILDEEFCFSKNFCIVNSVVVAWVVVATGIDSDNEN